MFYKEYELSTMHEVSHIQEVLDALEKLVEDPNSLPPASEQVIQDLKASDTSWSFRVCANYVYLCVFLVSRKSQCYFVPFFFTMFMIFWLLLLFKYTKTFKFYYYISDPTQFSNFCGFQEIQHLQH